MKKLTVAKPDRVHQIKTPQSFIHIEHRISLLQYKYWILLLREYRQQMDARLPADERGWRYLPMKTVVDALGYEPRKSEVWEDLEALKNQTFAYNFLSKDGESVRRGSGFITEWQVSNSRIGFKLPDFCVDAVMGVDQPGAIFHMLNWQIFNAFSGKHEAVIYKLCRDYRGATKTPYFDLASFRAYMGLADTAYPDFRELNRNVISGPVNMINKSEFSDLLIQVEFHKQGRKVVGLRFTFKPKQLPLLAVEKENHPAFQHARVHIDNQMQAKYLELRTPEEIELCIDRANEYGEQQGLQGREPNYGALYRTAITEGWHIDQAEKNRKVAAAHKRMKATEQVLQAQEAEVLERDSDIARQIRSAIEAFNALPEADQATIKEEFAQTLKVAAMKKSFAKGGIDTPIIRPVFAEYFANRQPHTDTDVQMRLVD